MNNLIFFINFIFVFSLFYSLILAKCTACMLIFNLYLGITNAYLGLVNVGKVLKIKVKIKDKGKTYKYF